MVANTLSCSPFMSDFFCSMVIQHLNCPPWASILQTFLKSFICRVANGLSGLSVPSPSPPLPSPWYYKTSLLNECGALIPHLHFLPELHMPPPSFYSFPHYAPFWDVISCQFLCPETTPPQHPSSLPLRKAAAFLSRSWKHWRPLLPCQCWPENQGATGYLGGYFSLAGMGTPLPLTRLL